MHRDVAEYLQRYQAGKISLLFHTEKATPHPYGNLADRWLTPRLKKMGLDEAGMGWHSFKRFRTTWLRGQRCLEDVNNYWMAHKPQTLSEFYLHLHEDVKLRLDEATRVGCGFVLPTPDISFVPTIPKKHEQKTVEVAAQMIRRAGNKLVDVTGFEPATPCLQSRCSPS